MKTMHLFAGAGGGILSDLILGHEPVVAVEWDAYCCQVLRERVEDGWFPGMQVWEGDVRLFDPSEYKGKVSGIHAGFPCTDVSNSGDQAGIGEGTRSGLYTEILRIADEVREEGEDFYLWLENVSAIVTGADGEWMRTILGDLAERGFDAVWCCLSASQVGAAHIRDRWWLLAYPDKSHGEGIRLSSRIQEEQADIGSRGKHGESKSKLADTKRIRQSGQRERIYTGDKEKNSERETSDVVNVRVGDFWKVEPKVGRVVDGLSHRPLQLRALGNAQVPLQAAAAFSILWQMMEAAND